jgi:hypothetical protein
VRFLHGRKKQLLTAPNKRNEQTALTDGLFFLSPLRLAAIDKSVHSLFYGFSRQPLKRGSFGVVEVLEFRWESQRLT